MISINQFSKLILLGLFYIVLKFKKADSETVFIGYANEAPACKAYLQNQQKTRMLSASKTTEQGINSFIERILKTKYTLRNHLLPSVASKIIQSELRSKPSFRKLFQNDANIDNYSIELTDNKEALETIQILPQEDVTKSRKLGEVNSIYPRMSWLKFVEIDDVYMPSQFNAEILQNNLKDSPCIEFIEINQDKTQQAPAQAALSNSIKEAVTSRRVNIPNDPYFSNQWQLEDIQLTDAWDLWIVDKQFPPIIGSIDLGCDVEHPDLKNSVWKNPGEICGNNVDDDNNGYIDDCYGFDFHLAIADVFDKNSHGTSSAGIMVAEVNNSIGIAGICRGCKVICAKVGDAGMFLDAFVRAVNYLMTLKVKIITYGGIGMQNLPQAAAIRAALSQGILFVTPAGNAACNLDILDTECRKLSYPAILQYDNIISVGSTNSKHAFENYSNYGSNYVDIIAPSGLLAPRAGTKDYAFVQGTSFSTPSVAAVIAYIWHRYPSLSASEMRRVILDSAVLYTDTNEKSRSGIVNAHRALMLGYSYSALKFQAVE